MKIHLLSCLLLAGACTAGAEGIECTYPREPSTVPNGKTATQEEMVVGMKATKDYNAQVTAYLACLDEKMNADIANAGPEASADIIDQIKAINAKRHNAAVEALESHAARFNLEVRAFKTRDKEEKK